MRRCCGGPPPGGTRFVVDIDAELRCEGEAMVASASARLCSPSRTLRMRMKQARASRTGNAVGVSQEPLFSSDHDQHDS